jgi:mono/diheme cytochrome c family protein
MSRRTLPRLVLPLHRRSLPALLALALAVGCSAEQPEPKSTASTPEAKPPAAAPKQAAAAAPQAPAPTKDPETLKAEGRQAFLSSCIACHNADPAKDGALGPAVAGSSYELLEARVMRAEYPPNYTPKRETRVMMAMPFLEKQLPALAAYLE